VLEGSKDGRMMNERRKGNKCKEERMRKKVEGEELENVELGN